MCLGLIELCLCICVSLADACVVSVLTVSVGPLGIFCCCQLGFLPHSKITVCAFSHLFVNVCVTLCVPNWSTVSLCSFTASQCNLHTFPPKYFQKTQTNLVFFLPLSNTENNTTQSDTSFALVYCILFKYIPSHPPPVHLFLAFSLFEFNGRLGKLRWNGMKIPPPSWSKWIVFRAEPLRDALWICEWKYAVSASGCVSALQTAEWALEVCNETTSVPATVVWQPGVLMFVHSYMLLQMGMF